MWEGLGIEGRWIVRVQRGKVGSVRGCGRRLEEGGGGGRGEGGGEGNGARRQGGGRGRRGGERSGGHGRRARGRRGGGRGRGRLIRTPILSCIPTCSPVLRITPLRTQPSRKPYGCIGRTVSRVLQPSAVRSFVPFLLPPHLCSLSSVRLRLRVLLLLLHPSHSSCVRVECDRLRVVMLLSEGGGVGWGALLLLLLHDLQLHLLLEERWVQLLLVACRRGEAGWRVHSSHLRLLRGGGGGRGGRQVDVEEATGRAPLAVAGGEQATRRGRTSAARPRSTGQHSTAEVEVRGRNRGRKAGLEGGQRRGRGGRCVSMWRRSMGVEQMRGVELMSLRGVECEVGEETRRRPRLLVRVGRIGREGGRGASEARGRLRVWLLPVVGGLEVWGVELGRTSGGRLVRLLLERLLRFGCALLSVGAVGVVEVGRASSERRGRRGLQRGGGVGGREEGRRSSRRREGGGGHGQVREGGRLQRAQGQQSTATGRRQRAQMGTAAQGMTCQPRVDSAPHLGLGRRGRRRKGRGWRPRRQ